MALSTKLLIATIVALGFGMTTFLVAVSVLILARVF